MANPLKPAALIRKYYASNPLAHELILSHSRLVAKKAVDIGRRLNAAGQSVNIQFLAEAAMLHDIGMILTDTPALGCYGSGSYLQHGVKGKELLLKEGLPRHANVCERHIGVGLSVNDIRTQNLPLPERDMRPQTLEEEIICYADLFYSKNKTRRNREKTAEEIRSTLKKFGAGKVALFNQWHKRFEPLQPEDRNRYG